MSLLPSAARVSADVRTDRISSLRLWGLVFVPVVLVFLSCGHWTLNNADSVAAAWPAWALVHSGTLHLEHVGNLPLDPWFIKGAHGHLVSSRMPGVVFISVPVQLAFAWTGLNAMAPSVATAALVTAAAVANMTLLLRRLSNASAALVGGLLLAFGTTLWTVAGAELWTHGPDVLWLSAGLLALANRRDLLAGLLFAPAVLTRPHLIVVVIAVAAFVGWSRRRMTIVPLLGVPAALALVGVIAYNWYLFGSASLGAGSYSYATDRSLTGGGVNFVSGLHNWYSTTVDIMASPMHGLLPYSPMAVLALFALRSSWRLLPDWGRGAAVGGVVYLLVQARINGVYSSFGFYGDRLAIESALLWSPLVFLSARTLWLSGRRVVVFSLCVASVGIELVGAAFGRVLTVPLTADPWRTWLPIDVVRSNGIKTAPILGGALLVAMLFGLRLLHRPDPSPQPAAQLPRPPRGQLAQPRSPMFNPSARAASPPTAPTTTHG